MWLYLSGCDPSSTAKSTPIVNLSSYHEWQTEISPKLAYSMMLDYCKGIKCHVPLILYMEDHPARDSVLQDMEKAWQMSEADYFSRSFAWPKKFDPISYSLRMCAESLHEAGRVLSERLPISAMIVDSTFFPLKSSLTKREKGGFVLPNLTASDGLKGPAKIYNRHGKQASMRNLVTISYRLWNAGVLSPEVCEKIMGFPSGWTELEDWAIAYVRSRRKKRSKS